jgi:hypothetical protein
MLTLPSVFEMQLGENIGVGHHLRMLLRLTVRNTDGFKKSTSTGRSYNNMLLEYRRKEKS